jgi:hypothetical protein
MDSDPMKQAVVSSIIDDIKAYEKTQQQGSEGVGGDGTPDTNALSHSQTDAITGLLMLQQTVRCG